MENVWKIMSSHLYSAQQHKSLVDLRGKVFEAFDISTRLKVMKYGIFLQDLRIKWVILTNSAEMN